MKRVDALRAALSGLVHKMRDRKGCDTIKISSSGERVEITIDDALGSCIQFSALMEVSRLLETTAINVSAESYECGTDVTPMSQSCIQLCCDDVTVSLDDEVEPTE